MVSVEAERCGPRTLDAIRILNRLDCAARSGFDGSGAPRTVDAVAPPCAAQPAPPGAEDDTYRRRTRFRHQANQNMDESTTADTPAGTCALAAVLDSVAMGSR